MNVDLVTMKCFWPECDREVKIVVKPADDLAKVQKRAIQSILDHVDKCHLGRFHGHADKYLAGRWVPTVKKLSSVA